jgi:class 3 adenylate cyclase
MSETRELAAILVADVVGYRRLAGGLPDLAIVSPERLPSLW